MLSSRSGKIPNSLRSSNSQWQKKQQPPPPPPRQQEPQRKVPVEFLTPNSTPQQQQQLISQDQCVAEEGPTLQWPWSAAHLTEHEFATYKYWYWQQQQLLLEQQQRLLLEQQQQQSCMNMNNYVNQFTTEPLRSSVRGHLISSSRLTAFLERDESFLTPWGKRGMKAEGEEFYSGEYASVYGERQPERMVFQHGSSFFSSQLY